MEHVQEMLAQARDAMTVKRVFGDPIERGDITVIPVAKVRGGGGGGGGSSRRENHDGVDQADPEEEGGGMGFGASASPLGVFVIKGDGVSWQPAVNVNQLVMGRQALGALALLVIFGYLRARRRR